MKKYILLFLCVSALAFGEDKKAYKLRDIATPSFLTLMVRIPFICIKDLGALKALWFILKNRHIKWWHGDNDLHDGDLTISGPDSTHLYAAIKYPALQKFLPDIFDAYTESMAGNIDKAKLKEFIAAKKEGTGYLTYNDDIDVVFRLRAKLPEHGYTEKDIADFLDNVTIHERNSKDVIAGFADYLEKNGSTISPDFYDMLAKKTNPTLHVPKGYVWKVINNN